MTRFVYIHGNGTPHWSAAFAPWLKAEIESRGHDTFFETMPDSINARAKYWLKFLEKTVCITEDDVIIGWSSGAVAAMRYAETHSYAGLILIGPHYTDLGIQMEKDSGYFDTPWDWEAIKRNVKKIVLIHGDHDPYIPREDFVYIAEQLGCERIEVPGGKHFEERLAIPEIVHSLAYFTDSFH